MKEKLSWHKISTAFEYGDLTPLAVAISVAHYGPVLASHGDNVVVAWAVGTLIDLLHFRTVRRLFQVTGRNQVIGHALVAVVTTAMALGYHLRFYEGDWLLAIPIPVGIAILAQHAAAQKQEAEQAKQVEQERQAAQAAAELEAARQHELKLAQLREREETKRVKATRPVQDTAQVTRGSAHVADKGYTDWRVIPAQHRIAMSGLSPEEIMQRNPQIALRTAQLWAQRAEQEAAQVAQVAPQNGKVKS